VGDGNLPGIHRTHRHALRPKAQRDLGRGPQPLRCLEQVDFCYQPTTMKSRRGGLGSSTLCWTTGSGRIQDLVQPARALGRARWGGMRQAGLGTPQSKLDAAYHADSPFAFARPFFGLPSYTHRAFCGKQLARGASAPQNHFAQK